MFEVGERGGFLTLYVGLKKTASTLIQTGRKRKRATGVFGGLLLGGVRDFGLRRVAYNVSGSAGRKKKCLNAQPENCIYGVRSKTLRPVSRGRRIRNPVLCPGEKKDAKKKTGSWSRLRGKMPQTKKFHLFKCIQASPHIRNN